MMVKNSINWHEECYGNWKKSLDKHEERTLTELEKIKEDRIRLNFYEDQIKSAKITGKDRFDREKYKVKHNDNTKTIQRETKGF